MEAEERPSKLRKLEHDLPNDWQPMAGNDAGQKVPPSQLTTDAHRETDSVESAAADATGSNERDAQESDSPASEDCDEPETPADRHMFAPPLSKNALKKIRKQERWDAGRDARKLKRKQKTVEKRDRKRAAKEEGRAAAVATRAAGEEAYHQAKLKRSLHTRLPITFVIDCGFDDLMTEKEMISLGSQLTRSYSDNHKAPYQAHLFVSSWGGQLKERFDTVLEKHHDNWSRVIFIKEDFVEAAERAREQMKGKAGGKLAGAFAAKEKNKMCIAKGSDQVAGMVAEGDKVIRGKDMTDEMLQPAIKTSKQEEVVAAEKPAPATTGKKEKPDSDVDTESHLSSNGHKGDIAQAAADTSVEPRQEAIEKEGEVVYLTSDSPHTLDRLQPYSTYIVGGLVDKNRHKGICYKTACRRGIKTAKLPIGEFMEMQSRFVLATNHVIEIMVRWLECGDWGESFVKVMPKRKGGVLKATCGIKQHVHGNEIEVDDITSGSGDLREANADAQSNSDA